MDAQLTAAQSEQFSVLEALITADTKMSSKEGDTLYDVTCSQIELDYIRCKHQALKLLTHKGSSLIIYPTIVLVEDSNNSFYIVPTSELQIDFNKSDRKNTKQNATEQKHVNEIQLSIPTMYEEVFYIEDKDTAEAFEEKYRAYSYLLNALNTPPVLGIKREYYNLVTEFGTKYFDFLNKLKSNESFINYVSVNKKDSNNISEPEYIDTIGLVDLLKCFNAVADIKNTSSNESFSIIYLQSKMHGTIIEKYEDVVMAFIIDNNPNSVYENIVTLGVYESVEPLATNNDKTILSWTVIEMI